jgi:segregation and condensation protein A
MKNKLDYEFTLNDFQGPLDLLLHLVKKKKMDIVNIDLSELTNQYLDFITKNKDESLDIMSEYLVIAAYLIELKSKNLLPKQKVSDIDDNYEAEQKAKLIANLLEYEQYKQATKKMGVLEEHRMMYFDKESDMLPETKQVFNEVFNIGTLNEKRLMQAASKMLERLKNEKPMNSKIQMKRISIEDRTQEIKELFMEVKREVKFIDLFEVYNNSYIAVTFFAILDLARNGFISIKQNEHFDDIFIK